MREKLIELIGDMPNSVDCIVAMADYLIANGVTIQKWIPVTERLPKLESYVYSVDVLFCDIIGNIYVGYASLETGAWKCRESREIFAQDKVTHWMPLPEPPKGE